MHFGAFITVRVSVDLVIVFCQHSLASEPLFALKENSKYLCSSA